MPNFGDHEAFYDPSEDFNDNPPRRKGKRLMVKITKKINPKKPSLVLMGEHLIDPSDVAAIKKVRSKDDLYIVVLKSQPNMEFPMWANGDEIAILLEHFNVVS